MKNQTMQCSFCGEQYTWDDNAPQWGHTDTKCIINLTERHNNIRGQLNDVNNRIIRLTTDLIRRDQARAAKEQDNGNT